MVPISCTYVELKAPQCVQLPANRPMRMCEGLGVVALLCEACTWEHVLNRAIRAPFPPGRLVCL